jgi:hypothetical protein
MMCGYEVSRMILLHAYLYTYSLLRGVTFGTAAVKELSAPLSQFFECLQYPEFFVPLRQTLFLKIATSHLEPNQGNRVGVPFQGQKQLDRECLVRWSIVTVENPILEPKFRPFFMHSFMYPLQ